MITNKQNDVLSYLRSVEFATKTDIYQNVSFSYYCNWQKHIGDLLSRMVKKGLIERPSRGIYRIAKSQAENTNQLDLL